MIISRTFLVKPVQYLILKREMRRTTPKAVWYYNTTHFPPLTKFGRIYARGIKIIESNPENTFFESTLSSQKYYIPIKNKVIIKTSSTTQSNFK